MITRIHRSVIAITMMAAMSSSGMEYAIDFARDAANIGLSHAEYTNRTDAARQIEATPEGLVVHLDSDKMKPRTPWATIYRKDWRTGKDNIYGKKYELVFRLESATRISRRIPINLNDREGETFQFMPTSVKKYPQRGEIVCTYEFTPSQNRRGWHNSPKADGKFDAPARFASLNAEFGGDMPMPDSLTLVAFRPAAEEVIDNQPRNVVSIEQIDISQVYPGAAPFHGAEWLEFEIENGYNGNAVLTLALPSPHMVQHGAKTNFIAKATGNGKVRFYCRLPYVKQYHFVSLKGPKNTKSGRGEFHQTEAEALRVIVETGNPLHIIRDEIASEQAEIVVSNASKREISASSKFILSDVFDRTITIPFAAKVPAEGELRLRVPQLPAKGVWYLNGDIKAGDGSARAVKAQFARIDFHTVTPKLEKPKFRFGIHYHGTRYMPDQTDITIGAIVAAGAKFTRTDYNFIWGDVERKEGVYDWAKADKLFAKIKEAGLAMEIICYSQPGWAKGRKGCFKNYCRKMAERYGTGIDYYEVGNEWDMIPAIRLPPKDALEIQKEAMEGLHEGCKGVCVIPNGWTGADSKTRNPDPKVENAGIIEAFAQHPELYDAWSIHCHNDFAAFVSSIQDQLLPLRENTPLKVRPWLCGETAVSSFSGGENEAARNVWAKILYAWAWGSSDHIWYNLKSTGWFDGFEPGFGLVTANFQPRAAYAAFAAATKIFEGLDADGRIYSKKLRHVLRFKGKKDGFEGVVLAGWEYYSKSQRIVRIKTDAKSAQIADYMGNRTTAKIADGVVEFAIDKNPRALILNGATMAVAADMSEIK